MTQPIEPASNASQSSLYSASPEQIARWLMDTLRPQQVIDAAGEGSSLFAALVDQAASRGLPIRQVGAPDALGSTRLDALVMLAPDQISDGWQLMDWMRRLDAKGGILLLGPPPRESAITGHALADGQHWLFVADPAWSGASAPSGSSYRTEIDELASLETAQAVLMEQRQHIEQLRGQVVQQQSSLSEVEQGLLRAERRVASLRRALETSGITSQATLEHLHRAQNQVGELLNSRSWRVTAPLRLAHVAVWRIRSLLKQLLHLSTATIRVARQNGMREAGRRVASQLRQPAALFRMGSGAGSWKLKPVHMLPPARPAASSQQLRVLLVAEMGIGQCLKYRVLQKQLMIESLGYDCTVVNWTDVVCTRDLLSTHSVAVFYRVPG